MYLPRYSTILGEVATAWTRLTFNACARSFIYSADVTVEQGIGAGLAVKQSPDGYNGIILMLDFNKNKLQLLSIPGLAVFDSRDFKFDFNRTYNIRIVSKDKFLECYIDDVLYIQCVCYFAREGYFGLVIDRCRATFGNITAVGLECLEE